MPFMFVAIFFAARFAVRRFSLPPAAGVRLSLGAVVVALLLCAELLLAVVLQGQSIGQYIASRDPVSESVYLAGLGIFALMPFILARVHAAGLPSRHGQA